jgi:hypothetical protein
MKASATILTLIILVLTVAGPAGAWSSDPTVNTPVCTDLAEQDYPTVCHDGAGGAYVVWEDRRGLNTDLYAQRLDADGNQLWTPLDGIVICNYAGDQFGALVSADGDSGCYIVWRDNRPAPWHGIYAQRLDAAGNARWQTNGAIVLTGYESLPNDILTIPMGDASDPGGMATVWSDSRNWPDINIYWQWLDRDGVNRLSYNGNPLCTAAEEQAYPRFALIGESALVFWIDRRDHGNWRVYAQKIEGEPPVPQWMADGIPVTDLGIQYDDYDVVTNGDETAIVTWRIQTIDGQDVMAQRIDQAGNILWGASGTVVCDEPYDQGLPKAVADGSGGAVVVWQDWDDLLQLSGLSAQRLNGSGVRQWAAGGVPIVVGPAVRHRVTGSALGGAIVAWADYRGQAAPDPTGVDIYAQRIDLTGAVQWATDGEAVSTADLTQTDPVLCSDGLGGAIVAWTDQRNGLSNRDIYAQQIAANGRLGALSAVPLDDSGAVARLRALPAEPNPFAQVTTIAWEQAAAADTRIEVFDLAGRRVARHLSPGLQAGSWGYRFLARGDDGRALPSGVYVYRVTAGAEQVTGKIVLMR